MDLCIGFAQIRAILFHKQLKSRGLYSQVQSFLYSQVQSFLYSQYKVFRTWFQSFCIPNLMFLVHHLKARDAVPF